MELPGDPSTAYCNCDIAVNLETEEIITLSEGMDAPEGFITGCGCYLQDKVNKLKNTCPNKFWKH